MYFIGCLISAFLIVSAMYKGVYKMEDNIDLFIVILCTASSWFFVIIVIGATIYLKIK